MNRNLFSALKLEKTMMFLLLVLITIGGLVQHRQHAHHDRDRKTTRDLAILKAMGAARKGIMRIFMLNGLIIGCSGAAIGVPLGYAFLWLIQTFWTFDPTVLLHFEIQCMSADPDVFTRSQAQPFSSVLPPPYIPSSRRQNSGCRAEMNDHAAGDRRGATMVPRHSDSAISVLGNMVS